MHPILKASAFSFMSIAIAVSAGCANQRSNEVVIAPMATPSGNAVYQSPALVTNSPQTQAAAQNVQGVVHFAFDSSEINAIAAEILDNQVEFLANTPDARVLIAGHTDERGSNDYNLALGQRRADAVRVYLANKGIDNARIETISYGEENPVAMGNDEQSHALNRRAELSY